MSAQQWFLCREKGVARANDEAWSTNTFRSGPRSKMMKSMRCFHAFFQLELWEASPSRWGNLWKDVTRQPTSWLVLQVSRTRQRPFVQEKNWYLTCRSVQHLEVYRRVSNAQGQVVYFFSASWLRLLFCMNRPMKIAWMWFKCLMIWYQLYIHSLFWPAASSTHPFGDDLIDPSQTCKRRFVDHGDPCHGTLAPCHLLCDSQCCSCDFQGWPTGERADERC